MTAACSAKIESRGVNHHGSEKSDSLLGETVGRIDRHGQEGLRVNAWLAGEVEHHSPIPARALQKEWSWPQHQAQQLIMSSGR